MKSPESFFPVYDFRQQIQTALDDAPLVDTEVNNYQQDELLPGDIEIAESHVYPILIRQTFEVVYPNLEPKTIDRLVREKLEHEMAHAAAAGMLGKNVRFRIRILKENNKGQQRRLLAFAINIDNPLTKEELAFIANAPETIVAR